MAFPYNNTAERGYSLDALFVLRSKPAIDMETAVTESHEQPETASDIPAAVNGVSRLADRETLFATFTPWLNRQMRRYRLNSEEREDAYGELFCRLCSLLDQYDPQRGIPLEPYLYRQLGAFLYSHARTGWRRNRRELPFYAEDGSENIAHLAGDPTPEWDDHLVTTQVQSLLPIAFRQIPARQQDAITLRYFHDLS